jgi:hypothetical protein
MAVTVNTGVKLQTPFGNASVVTWTNVPTGNTGDPIQNPTFSDRSVQVTGTFGGATCAIEGSNDGSNWVTLTDPAGVATSFTTAGLKQILQVTRYIRPNVSGGAGTLTINLLIVGK